MAVRTQSELLELINKKFADNTDDDTLSLIEDITDTTNDLISKSSGNTDWEQKFKDNDAMWRKKYRDRFFNGNSEDDDNDDEDDEPKKMLTYEDLFKAKEN